ncbi:ATP-binding protein, partial [Arsukibacterium sp.]|uniref:ATP-binding protein n=1 Tax=Arsukibacterium sp. TaxID=1977258 RepID=UPI00299E5040
KRAGQQLHIKVIDTGVGIAKTDQQRIFEEFQQGSQPDQKGLGLGLAIAHRISAILGHPLTVQSTPGKGSCFCLSLPLAAAPATPSVPSVASSEISARFAGKKILLLDNEAHLLSAVSALLSSWQCQVTAVSQPGEALAAISQGLKPDLCLFDYHLDNAATGVAVAEQLVSHFSINAPVIIHSADHDQNIRELALNSGFYFLLKPLKPAALKRLFQRLLRG